MWKTDSWGQMTYGKKLQKLEGPRCLQDGSFNCSSRFSVPEWKVNGSQSELIVQEILNTKSSPFAECFHLSIVNRQEQLKTNCIYYTQNTLYLSSFFIKHGLGPSIHYSNGQPSSVHNEKLFRSMGGWAWPGSQPGLIFTSITIIIDITFVNQALVEFRSF